MIRGPAPGVRSSEFDFLDFGENERFLDAADAEWTTVRKANKAPRTIRNVYAVTASLFRRRRSTATSSRPRAS